MDEQEIREDERRRIAEMCRLLEKNWEAMYQPGKLRGTWFWALSDEELAEYKGRAIEARHIAELLEEKKP